MNLRRQRTGKCGTLKVRSSESECGIAGKDLAGSMKYRIHEVWPETAIRLSRRGACADEISSMRIRAGCSGWKTRQRTRLAVQQQRFEPDGNADLEPKGAKAPLHCFAASSTHFLKRNILD